MSRRGHVGNLPPAARRVDERVLVIAFARRPSSREEEVAFPSYTQRDETVLLECKWERGE